MRAQSNCRNSTLRPRAEAIARATSTSKPLQAPVLSTELCGAKLGILADDQRAARSDGRGRAGRGVAEDRGEALGGRLRRLARPDGRRSPRRPRRRASRTAAAARPRRADRRRLTSAGHQTAQLVVERGIERRRRVVGQQVAREAARGLARVGLGAVGADEAARPRRRARVGAASPEAAARAAARAAATTSVPRISSSNEKMRPPETMPTPVSMSTPASQRQVGGGRVVQRRLPARRPWRRSRLTPHWVGRP